MGDWIDASIARPAPCFENKQILILESDGAHDVMWVHWITDWTDYDYWMPLPPPPPETGK